MEQKKNWSNITVKDYDQIMEILNSEKEAFEKNVELLSMIYEEDESTFWNMEVSKINQYVETLQFLNDYKFVPFKNVKTVKIRGREYSVAELSKITTAQYFDFINISKAPKEPAEQLVDMLSVLLIPKNKTYNEGYDVETVKNDIYQYLSFSTAQSLLGFAMAKYAKSMMPSPRYLAKMAKKMTKKEKEAVVEKIDEAISQLLSVGSL